MNTCIHIFNKTSILFLCESHCDFFLGMDSTVLQKLRAALTMIRLVEIDLAERTSKTQVTMNENNENKSHTIVMPLRFILNFDGHHNNTDYAFLFYDSKSSLFQIQSEYNDKPLAAYLDDRCCFTLDAALDATLRWLESKDHHVSLEIACFTHEEMMQKLGTSRLVPITVTLDQPKEYGSRSWSASFDVDLSRQCLVSLVC